MAVDRAAELTPEELRLFVDRIGRGLEERPLGLEPAAHRERVAELIEKTGGWSFYELLSLGPACSPAEVHDAYERLARTVHPRHARPLGLAGREGVLDLLFERATRAYLTLSHPDRRRGYDLELAPSAWASPVIRGEEARATARGYYERAASLVAASEYHFAVDLLRHATRSDPRPEYFALLGRVLARNPAWLREAADSFRSAIELGDRDPEIAALLRQVREQLEGPAPGAVEVPAKAKSRRFLGRG